MIRVAWSGCQGDRDHKHVQLLLLYGYDSSLIILQEGHGRGSTRSCHISTEGQSQRCVSRKNISGDDVLRLEQKHSSRKSAAGAKKTNEQCSVGLTGEAVLPACLLRIAQIRQTIFDTESRGHRDSKQLEICELQDCCGLIVEVLLNSSVTCRSIRMN